VKIVFKAKKKKLKQILIILPLLRIQSQISNPKINLMMMLTSLLTSNQALRL